MSNRNQPADSTLDSARVFSPALEAAITGWLDARLAETGSYAAWATGVCVGCDAAVCAEHDLFCCEHHVAMLANRTAKHAELVAEQAAKRSLSARSAAETRRLADGSQVIDGKRVTRTSAQVAAGQARYRQIRSRMANRF